MEDPRHDMRHSNQLSELSIKVPAPFAGISDLGFTAQYRAQQFNEPLRDVPLLIEGPRPPMRRLVFPFLHDCAAVARLQLSSYIEMHVSMQDMTIADITLPLGDIVESNGDRLLWQ